MISHVFISHSGNAGERVAGEIREALSVHAAQIGLRRTDMGVFIASDCLRVGSDMDAGIRQSIRECRWFFLVITRESNQSHYVRYELRLAGESRKIILPVLGEGMTPEDMPPTITKLVAVSLTDVGKMTVMLADIANQQKRRISALGEKPPDRSGGGADIKPHFHGDHRRTYEMEIRRRPEERAPRAAGPRRASASRSFDDDNGRAVVQRRYTFND